MFPPKSRTKQSFFPGAIRKPRPQIWANKPGEQVARSTAIASTTGASKPVVSTSTLTSHRRRRSRKSRTSSARSRSSDSPVTTPHRSPVISCTVAATCSACNTPAAKSRTDVRPTQRATISATARFVIASLSKACSTSLGINSPPRIRRACVSTEPSAVWLVISARKPS